MDRELGALLGQLLLNGLILLAISSGLLAWLHKANRPKRAPLKLTRNNKKDNQA
jgi:hypothetical protein